MASPEQRESSPWTLVNHDGEEESQEDGNTSSSSSEFVQVTPGVVSYHHLRRENSSNSDTDISVVSSLSDGGEDALKDEDLGSAISHASDTDAPLDLRIQSNVSTTEQEKTAFSLHTVQKLHQVDSESLSSGILDHDPRLPTSDVMTASDSSGTGSYGMGSAANHTSSDTTSSCGTTNSTNIGTDPSSSYATSNDSSTSSSSSDTNLNSCDIGTSLNSCDISGTTSAGSSCTDSNGTSQETVASSSCSDSPIDNSIQEKQLECGVSDSDDVVDMSVDNMVEREGAIMGVVTNSINRSVQKLGRTCSREGSLALKLVLRPRSPSTSDSDSDFSHLDLNSEEDEVSERDIDTQPPPDELVAPSVDQAFRFVVAGEEDRAGDENEVDVSTESGMEDDRIESDQSEGFAGLHGHDDDDDDLSYSHAGIENLPLHEQNLNRQYVHQPNKGLSGTLSLLVIMTGWLALGLGIGHSISSSRERAIYHDPAHSSNLHSIQDDLLICLQKKQTLISHLESQNETWKAMVASREGVIWEKEEQLNELHRDVVKLEEDNERLLRVKGVLESLVESISRKSKADLEPPEKSVLHVCDIDGEMIDNEAELERSSVADHGGDNDDINCTTEEVPDKEVLTSPKQSVDETNSSQDATDLLSGNSEEEKTERKHEVDDVEEERVLMADEIRAKDNISSPTSEEHENETEKLRHELNLANSRAEMWQSLYLSEQHQRHNEDTAQVKGNFAPSMLSCLNLFRPQVKFSQIMLVVNQTLIKGMTQFQNLTNLTRYLEESWEDMKATSASEFQTVFNEIAKLWVGWGNKNPGMTTSEETPKGQKGVDMDDKDRDKMNSGDSKSQGHHGYGKGRSQYFWSKSVKDFLNKTQQSMSEVSKEIQEKWKRVKNLSKDLWKKHEPTINMWQQNLSQGFAKMSSRLTEKIQKKTRTWFRSKKQRKEVRKQERRHKRHNNQEKKEEKSRKFERKFNKGHGKRHGKHEKWHGKHRKHEKWHKKHEKWHGKQKWHRHQNEDQTEEKHHCKGRHCQRGYPEEMQKDLKKLHHTIGRINFKGFARMSRDDIEDVYEDLLDFGKKIHQSETDESWLNCQVTWWKAHFHGNSFLKLDRCTRNLEKWQVKVEEAYVEVQSKIHQDKKKPKQHPRDSRQQEKRSEQEKNEFGGAFGRTKRRAVKGEDNSWEDNKQHKEEKQNCSVSGEWFFKLHDTHNHRRGQDSWYIQRMDDRKKHHQDLFDGQHSGASDWVFERAEERDFQRSTPDDWYFQRATRRHVDHNRKHKWRRFFSHSREQHVKRGSRVFDCSWF